MKTETTLKSSEVNSPQSSTRQLVFDHLKYTSYPNQTALETSVVQLTLAVTNPINEETNNHLKLHSKRVKIETTLETSEIKTTLETSKD